MKCIRFKTRSVQIPALFLALATSLLATENETTEIDLQTKGDFVLAADELIPDTLTKRVVFKWLNPRSDAASVEVIPSCTCVQLGKTSRLVSSGKHLQEEAVIKMNRGSNSVDIAVVDSQTRKLLSMRKLKLAVTPAIVGTGAKLEWPLDESTEKVASIKVRTPAKFKQFAVQGEAGAFRCQESITSNAESTEISFRVHPIHDGNHFARIKVLAEMGDGELLQDFIYLHRGEVEKVIPSDTILRRLEGLTKSGSHDK